MDSELVLWRLEKATKEALEAHSQLAFSLGIYFGYPLCCRLAFCSDIINGRESNERAIDGSGFIPCRECFVKIKLKEIELKDLIKDRVSPIKFESYEQ
jgi:hypothetical protein